MKAWTDERGDHAGAARTIDDAMGLSDERSHERFGSADDAAATAGLIVLYVLVFVFTVGFIAGCTVRSLLG